MLREADREDVLHQVDTETLDRIAHRLFSESHEHLSHYDHLNKEDKRQKMEYLRRAAEADEFNDSQARRKHDQGEYFQHQQHTEDERRIQEEWIQRQLEQQHQKREDERREQEEIEKRIRDQRDEERKAAEEQEKRDEERRRRRMSQERREKEEAYRVEEERIRAQWDAERDHELRHHHHHHRKNSNSIYDRLPSLMTLSNLSPMDNQSGHPIVYPVKVPAYSKDHPYGYKQDKNYAIEPRFQSNEMGSDFVIEPRFKTHAEYNVVDVDANVEEEKKSLQDEPQPDEPPQIVEEEQVKEEIPFVDKRMIHQEIDSGEHGDDERRSDLLSSSESSSSSEETSSSLSSSSSSTSSLSSSDTWVSDSEGFHTMDEKEVQAYESWVNERLAKRRKTHAIDEDLLRYEHEQRQRQELSAGKFSEAAISEPTSSEGRSSAKVSPRKPTSKQQQAKKKAIKKTIEAGEENSSGSEESGPFELDSGYGLSSDEGEQRSREIREKYESEIAAAHSDEEHYFAHYSRLQEEMQHLAEEAEKVKDEARHVAEEADQRAQSAQQKVLDAERRAADLDRQAREAEQRVAELERKAKEAEARVEKIEMEWQTAQSRSRARQKQIAEEEQSEEERLHEQMLHHRAANADSDYSDDIDFSSYGEEVDGQVADDLSNGRSGPAAAEPIQYMKHGSKRHKDILARRGYKTGGKTSRRAYKAKKLVEDPQARKKAKKALKENPEAAKKIEKIVEEIGETDTRLGKKVRRGEEMEADRDTERRREEMGEWGHAKTIYPDEYEGPRLDEIQRIRKNPKEPERQSHEKIDKREKGGKRAKTVYPPEYMPPKIDDQQDSSELKKPVSPMVMKQEKAAETFKESVYHQDTTDSEADNEWDFKRKIREYRLRSEKLDWIDKEVEDELYHEDNYNGKPIANETIGQAIIEENEKERALEIYRQKTEQELKNEYDRKVVDLTKDYQSKLKDMDLKYSEKQYELDHQRQEIERSIEFFPVERFEPAPIKRFEPAPIERFEPAIIPTEVYDRTVSVIPRDSHLPLVEFELHPQYRRFDEFGPSPETQTFDETEFGFVRDRPIIGMNLAHKQVPNQAEKDPMADIKKREQDLQKERQERETELQADYQKRLAEFEKDYHEKEAALEKERLEQERIMIAEREHQIELDAKAARKLRKKQRKAAMAPQPEPFIEDEQEDLDLSEPEEDDLEDSSLYGEEDDYDDLEDDSEMDAIDDSEEQPLYQHGSGDHYGDSFDDDFNGTKNSEPVFSSEGEAEFFHETQDSRGQDIYEVEWELDLVPKRVMPPAKPTTPKPATADPAKKDRKAKKDKKEKKDRKDKKSANNHKKSRKNDQPKEKRPAERKDKPKEKKSKNKRNQKKNQEQIVPPFAVDRSKQKHHHKRQNGIYGDQENYSIEFSHYGLEGHMDLGHEPIVTERYGHFDGYDYGHDVTGQAYKYERYALANPSMPELPVARVPVPPERPVHPLQGYADAHDYYALNGAVVGKFKDKKPEEGPMPYPQPVTQPSGQDKKKKNEQANLHDFAHPMVKGVKYPDKKPGPEFYQSPIYAIHRERYGPQYHDRTPELIEETQSQYQRHQQPYFDQIQNPIYGEEELGYDMFDHSVERPIYSYMPAANEMQTKTFPKLKPYHYKPEVYAKSLAEAHKAGNLPPQEEEIPLHRQAGLPVHVESSDKNIHAHEHQTRSFDELHKTETDSMPVHKDQALNLDKEKTVKKEETTVSKTAPKTAATDAPHRDLQLKIPKDIQHITDLPARKPPTTSTPKPASSKKGASKRKEEQRDVIPQADLTAPGSFQARRDPFSLDFEKIALRRAAKQSEFRRKYEDEQFPRDKAHGGRFAYHGEHRAEDLDMLESPQHAQLEKVFQESEELYHEHELMKPRFEDFKLQFQGLHEQVADYIPEQEVIELKKLETAYHPADKQQEDAMPITLYTGSIPQYGPMTKSYIPTQPLPVMSSSESPVQRTEHESPLALDVMSQPLEDPSIHDRMHASQQSSSRFGSMSKAQQTYELPVFDPSTTVRQPQQPSFVQQQLQQPTMYTGSSVPLAGSMYQAPTPWYAQTPAFGTSQLPVQPQYMGQPSQMPQRPLQQLYPAHMQSQQQPMMLPPQQQQTTLYPSTPYMPPELSQLPTTSPSGYQQAGAAPSQPPPYQQYAVAGGVLPTKTLPYQPRQMQATAMPSSFAQRQPQTTSPGITMTRELTTTPAATGAMMPSATRSAAASSRNNLDYSRHMRTHDFYGGDFDYEEAPIDLDEQAYHDYNDHQYIEDDDEEVEPYWYGDVHHVYTDHGDVDAEHPVYVTSSDPHSYFTHDADSDEFIVGTFLESKNDLEAARESNKFLQ